MPMDSGKQFAVSNCDFRAPKPLFQGLLNGGVSRSGLVLPFLSLFVLFCPFGTFPDFPGFSRLVRGLSGDFPDWSFSSFSAYQQHLQGTVPEGSATQSGPFPKKVGNPGFGKPPVWLLPTKPLFLQEFWWLRAVNAKIASDCECAILACAKVNVAELSSAPTLSSPSPVASVPPERSEKGWEVLRVVTCPSLHMLPLPSDTKLLLTKFTRKEKAKITNVTRTVEAEKDYIYQNNCRIMNFKKYVTFLADLSLIRVNVWNMSFSVSWVWPNKITYLALGRN